MAEPQGVLAGKPTFLGPDELLTDERSQAWSHVRLVGRQSLHGAAVEDLALDRAAFEHASLERVELVEACRKERLQGGSDNHLAGRLLAPSPPSPR